MDLSKEAQQWYDKIKDEHDIQDKSGLLLLQTAFEAFDEMREAQAEMNPGGFIVDRFGQRKKDPASTEARAARSQMLQSLKALNLEIEPPETKPQHSKPKKNY